MPITDDQIIQWVICTSEQYKALTKHADNKLYFLYDTEEFYRGDIPFTTSIIFYDGARPITGARRKIYIDTATLNGYVYDGVWQQVITQYNVVNDITENTAGNSIPSVTALRKFIETSISDMKYNPESHAIEYTQGNLVKSVVIDGLPTDIEYDEKTNCINLYDVNHDKIGTAKLPKDKALTKVIYDPATKNLIFTVTNTDGSGEPIEITMPAQDLIAIPISKVDGNLLKENPDGYAVTLDISGKMDKAKIRSDEDIGGVLIAANDGNANPTRYQIGGPHLSLEDLPEGGQQPKDNLLATEQAVYNFIVDLQKAVEVVASWVKIDTINKTSPNSNNITSEKAVAAVQIELEKSINNLSDTINNLSTSLRTSISNNAAKIEQLQTVIDNNSASTTESYNSLKTEIDSANALIQNNSSNISENTNDIAEVQNSVETLLQTINGLTEIINKLSQTHDVDIQNIQTDIETLYNNVNDLSSQITNISSSFNQALVDNVNTINTNINAISTRVSTLENKITEIEATKVKVYD